MNETIQPDLFPDDIQRSWDISVNRVIEAFRFSTSLGLGRLYVCFSGGKDSVAVYGLCKMASERLGIELLDMCKFVYNLTTVDPPDLVLFIKKEYPFVIIERPEMSMWQLIPKKKIPPTRLARYCCAELKERGGQGRFCITGVRWAESSRRKNNRGIWEKESRNKEERILNSDNSEDRRELEHCIPKRKYICNPIVDWSDEEVWRFIKENNIPYCKLYDEGFKRIGCIGCPYASKKERLKEFDRWPKYREQYIRTFEKMIAERRKAGLDTEWDNGEQVMEWWLNG